MATADSTTVEYREIPNFPGYRIGSDGSVWSCWRTRPGGRFRSEWRPMRLSPGARGYLRVNLTAADGNVRMFRVHHLVLLAFVGPSPEGTECRHRNGIKTDNRADNLLWGTPLENRQDNHDLGVYERGERHTQAKLVEADVRAIRVRRANGESLKALAAEYGVKESNICSIAKRRSWKHVV